MAGKLQRWQLLYTSVIAVVALCAIAAVAQPYGSDLYSSGGYGAAAAPPTPIVRHHGGGGGGLPNPVKPIELPAISQPEPAPPSQPAPVSPKPDVAPVKTIESPPSVPSQSSELQDMESNIKEMESAGFATTQIQGLYRDATNAENVGDKERLSQLLQQVTLIKENAKQSRSLLHTLEQQLGDASLTNNTITGNAIIEPKRYTITEELMRRAHAAEDAEDYTLAASLAQQAQRAYTEEQNRADVALFIREHWTFLIIMMGICAIIVFLSRISYLRKTVTLKIKLLEQEEYALTSELWRLRNIEDGDRIPEGAILHDKATKIIGKYRGVVSRSLQPQSQATPSVLLEHTLVYVGKQLVHFRKLQEKVLLKRELNDVFDNDRHRELRQLAKLQEEWGLKNMSGSEYSALVGIHKARLKFLQVHAQKIRRASSHAASTQ